MKFVVYLLNLLVILFAAIGLLGLYLTIEDYLIKDLPRVNVIRGIAVVFILWSIAVVFHFIREEIFKHRKTLIRAEGLVAEKTAQTIGVTILVTAIGLWVVYYGLVIRASDMASIKEANDNADRDVPHTYDLWMDNFANQQASTTDRLVVTPQDIVAIKNGQYVVHLSGYWGGKNHDVALLFNDDGKSACVVSDSGQKYNDCTEGNFVAVAVKQVMPLALRMVHDHWGPSAEQVLMMLDYEGETMLVAGHLNRSDRDGAYNGSFYNTSILLVPNDTWLSERADTVQFIQSSTVGYQEIILDTPSGQTESVWLQTIVSKHGPVYKLVRTAANRMIVQALPVYQTDSNNDFTKYPYVTPTQIGEVTLQAPMTEWYVNQFYARNSGFTAYATSTSQERMYFPSSCGLPPTFSDMSFFVTPFQGWASQSRWINLAVHIGVPTSAVWNLTTDQYGYLPSDWGQIMEQVSVSEYLAAVTQGISYKNLPTDSLVVGGVSVRHILPNNAPRPCDKSTSEMYQWVKSGVLYSMHVSYERDRVISTEDQSFVQTVLEDLVTQAAYAKN